MVIRVALCLILFAAAMPAQWKRYVDLIGQGRVDSPPAHDLQYFKLDPYARCDNRDQLAPCEEPPSEEEIQRRAQTRAEILIIGRAGRFTVYDVEYFFDFNYPGPHMRSALVEAPGHRFHEICIQDKLPGGTLFPTTIVQGGRQPILSLTYDDGSMYHNRIERAIVISDAGAASLDFDPVVRAAKEALPEGIGLYQSAVSFKDLVYTVWTERLDANVGMKLACCEGRIEVPFRIEKGIIVAGKAQYISGWPPGNARPR